MNSNTDTAPPAPTYADTGFDDRVRDGCGLMVAALLGMMFAGAIACEPLFWISLAGIGLCVAWENFA